jgi:2-oxoglutarate dehydrogenase N-terminus
LSQKSHVRATCSKSRPKRPLQVLTCHCRGRGSPSFDLNYEPALYPLTMLSRQTLRRLPAVLRSKPLSLAPSLRRDLATPTANPPSPNDPFANGTNAYYAEEMYRHWKHDPSSVHASWDAYFSGMDKGLPSFKAFQPPPTHLPSPADGAPALHVGSGAELDDHLKASRMPGELTARSNQGHIRHNYSFALTKCVGIMSPN